MLNTGDDRIEALTNITLASGLSGKDRKVQAAIFLHIAGPEALEVCSTCTLKGDDNKTKVNKIIEKFDQYCNPHKNIMWECHKFNMQSQQPGESINQCYWLKNKSQGVCVCSVEGQPLFVIELCVALFVTRLTPTFSKKVSGCIKYMQATSSQVKSLSDTLESHHDAFAVQKWNSSDKYKPKCDKCGNQHYCHQPCPAQSVECYNCGLRNHFAKVC